MRITGRVRGKARLSTATVLGVVMLAAIGCRGVSTSILEDTAPPPPSVGSGSGTLHVVVRVDVHETAGGGFETGFVAAVRDTLGAPVSGDVIVSCGFGPVLLAEVESGVYGAQLSGHQPGPYTLSVQSQAGHVSDVTVWMPDLHTITTPTSGQTVQADTALNVRWQRDEPAAECRLETLDYDSGWIYGDPGSLYTPTIGNPPRTDQRILVERRNGLPPAGALFGSFFSANVSRVVEPIIAQ